MKTRNSTLKYKPHYLAKYQRPLTASSCVLLISSFLFLVICLNVFFLTVHHELTIH